jgi:hypothetical protein
VSNLIYASASSAPQTTRTLESILDACRTYNGRSGVTGMLLHADGSFFQILEGSAEAIDSTFQRIERDARHQQATCIIREPIARRAFREWTMGYADISPAQLAGIIGANDFFQAGKCLTDVDAGRARKLLQAFAAGRWRTRLRTPVSA